MTTQDIATTNISRRGMLKGMATLFAGAALMSLPGCGSNPIQAVTGGKDVYVRNGYFLGSAGNQAHLILDEHGNVISHANEWSAWSFTYDSDGVPVTASKSDGYVRVAIKSEKNSAGLPTSIEAQFENPTTRFSERLELEYDGDRITTLKFKPHDSYDSEGRFVLRFDKDGYCYEFGGESNGSANVIEEVSYTKTSNGMRYAETLKDTASSDSVVLTGDVRMDADGNVIGLWDDYLRDYRYAGNITYEKVEQPSKFAKAMAHLKPSPYSFSLWWGCPLFVLSF